MKSIITAIIVAAVISGSSGAASLLFDGHKLKNHSVPVTKLTASAVQSLQGQRGAQGVPGAKGSQGAQGIQGAQGVPGAAGFSGLVGGVGGANSTVSVAAGAQGSAFNLCPAGTQPLGGGFTPVSGTSALRAVSSSLFVADSGVPGWSVKMANEGAGAESFHVQVRCA